jgi:uncharacterized membrane protein
MVQDPSYGVRQLADVALKALSPGVNDPTTAADAIQHLGAVLAEAYRRDPPTRRYAGEEGRVLTTAPGIDHARLTAIGFDEVRRDAANHPTIAIGVIELIGTLLQSPGVGGRPQVVDALLHQARLVLEGCERADLLPDDRDLVRMTYERAVAEPVAEGELRPR